MAQVIFWGETGAGKTALARKYAALPGAWGRMHWIDAAFDNGVTAFRDTIKLITQQKQHGGGMCLIVIDNAELLTLQCQQALRRIMEKQSHLVRFCFCVQGVPDVLIHALRSRCLLVDAAKTDCVDIFLGHPA